MLQKQNKQKSFSTLFFPFIRVINRIIIAFFIDETVFSVFGVYAVLIEIIFNYSGPETVGALLTYARYPSVGAGSRNSFQIDIKRFDGITIHIKSLIFPFMQFRNISVSRYVEIVDDRKIREYLICYIMPAGLLVIVHAINQRMLGKRLEVENSTGTKGGI